MCTVLQQHLNKLANGYHLGSDTYDGPRGRSVTPGSTLYQQQQRIPSPVRLTPTPIYSYLQDSLTLKRPVDVYDKKVTDPVKLPHYHIPINPDGSRIPSRSRSSYMQQLYGRRSRSLSRTGMRVLVDELEATAPRPRSPHMNNEEPINLSHYPDGRKPEEREDKPAPIERDDFPAPPFVYGDPKRRRHWSEPERNGRDSESDGVQTPVIESSDDEKEFVDEKLDKTESVLKKISTGMGQVFLTEIAIEREKRKMSRKRMLDPRSAARTPAANREPHYRLRFDSPVNASPSRIADHGHPWDDETFLDGTLSRRSYTPYLPVTPGATLGRVVSPVQPIKPGYTMASRACTLPPRFSPYDGDKAYSTDFGSKSDVSDVELNYKPERSATVITSYTSSTPHSYTSPRPQSAGDAGKSTPKLNRSLPEMPHDGTITTPAPNVYPLHLLQTTNYRLPGDVDGNNLERHLTDADFESVFKMGREDFYQIPYWKRCDIKKRHLLF